MRKRVHETPEHEHDIASGKERTMKLRPTPSANSIRDCVLDSLNSKVSSALVLLLAGATGLAAGRNPNPAVLPPGSAPLGRTYGDWAAAWWTWVVAGHWLMLAPLPKGHNTLRFGSPSRLGDFEFGVDVTYYLTVD